MDWASGHWPGIVRMCVWMRASCLGGWGCSGSGEQASWSQATNPTRTPALPLRGDTWPVASHLPRIAGRVLLASRAAWHPDGRQLGSLSIFSHEAGEIKSPHLSSASSLFVFSDNWSDDSSHMRAVEKKHKKARWCIRKLKVYIWCST